MDTPAAMLTGTVLSIIFYSEETGYTVAEISGDETFTAVGTMPRLYAGETVTLTGEWVSHALYGRQLHVRQAKKHEPQGADAIRYYLASGTVKGIGPALAARLTDRFGDETLRVLRSKPQLVATVKGISRAMAGRIRDQLADQQAEQDLAVLLMPAGISYNRVKRIYQALGIGTIDLVREDPWIITRLVSGIGFETAAKVADALGFADDHPARIRSAYWQLLYEWLQRGHTYRNKDALLNDLGKRLKLERHALDAALKDGVEGIRTESHKESTICSFSYIAEMEIQAAACVRQKMRTRLSRPLFLADAAADYAASIGMSLSDEQIQAITMGLNHGFSIITGGPGTGKTTIVRAMAGLAGGRGMRVALAAPTGRAARRLEEAAGQPAMTIHRLLNIQPDDGMTPELPETAAALNADLLIADESSMIDLPLFWRLMSALGPQTSLVLVGDADQLPSVGPGQVLRDLLSVEAVERTELTRIYRQSEDNLIAINAHRLNKGVSLRYPQKIDSPFLAAFADTDDAIVDTLERLIRGPLRDIYGISDVREVQILAPLRRGVAGVHQLNVRLQAMFQSNAAAEGLTFGQSVYYPGDKIIQTRNNYDLLWRNDANGETGSGVMNGETGIILHADIADRSLIVLFENERTVTLSEDDLLDIELAYAITIHKSQGSEYDTVCLILPHAPPDFLTKNLVYTAFTRAKSKLFLIGKRSALALVQRAGRVTTRQTRLAALLLDA